MRRLPLASLALLAAASACYTASQSTAAATPDRVLVVDSRGDVMRQTTLNDRTVRTIPAPLTRVWPAVLASYAEVGIEANYADQPRGAYGARNYRFPRTLNGASVGSFFSCGSSLTGANVDAGTVVADITTTVSATPDGQTTAVYYVSGWVRRNEGNSTSPVACSSTGRLEELLAASIERKSAAR